MERAEVANLWRDYQFYWLQTSNIQRFRATGRPIRTPKLTAERYALFASLYDWCVQKEVDPRLWLFALFRSRRWMFAPQPKVGHLLSEKFYAAGKYERVIEGGCLDGYRLYRIGQTATGLDPNKDLIPQAEQRKRVYQQNDQSDLCMLMTPSETFGYHPESQWCEKCPRKSECRDRLDRMVSFDVQALREGRLTVEQARSIVGA